jgi:hypothetical protein
MGHCAHSSRVVLLLGEFSCSRVEVSYLGLRLPEWIWNLESGLRDLGAGIWALGSAPRSNTYLSKVCKYVGMRTPWAWAEPIRVASVAGTREKRPRQPVPFIAWRQMRVPSAPPPSIQRFSQSPSQAAATGLVLCLEDWLVD